MERVLILATSAFVFLCVGVALVILASAPEKKEGEPPPAILAQPVPPPTPAPEPEPQPQPQPPSDAAARNVLDELVGDAPDYGAFFTRLRQAFPGEYEATVKAIKSQLDAAGRVGSVDYYVSDAIRLLRKGHGATVAEAGPDQIERVFDAQLAAMRAVAQEDPRMCVGFLYGATTQDFEKMAATHRPLVAEMALARLEATANGEAVKAKRAAPSEDEVKLFEKALTERGLTNDELDVFLGGEIAKATMDQPRMCAAGQSYLEALRTLPREVRMKIYSLLLEQMARS